MKKTIKRISFISVFVIMLFCLAFSATALMGQGHYEGEYGNIKWEFSEADGVLTLTGEDAMLNGTCGEDYPWYQYMMYIRKVQIDDRITYIGDYAFNFMGNCEIAGGAGVTDIGYRALYEDNFAYSGPKYVGDVLYSYVQEDTNVPYSSNVFIGKDIKHISRNFFMQSWQNIYYEGTEKEFLAASQMNLQKGTRVEYNHKHSYKTILVGNAVGAWCECNAKGTDNDTKVKNLTASATDSTVTLKWDKEEYVNKYIIYCYDNAKKAWKTCTSKGEFLRDAQDKIYGFKIGALKANAKYRFIVRSCIEEMDEVFKAPKYATVEVTTKLGKPKLTATGKLCQVDLKWTAVDGADGYRVYQKVNGSWKTLGYTNKLTYTVKNLTEGKKYYFAVKAYELKNSKKVYGSGYDSASAVVGKLVNPTVKATADYEKVTLKWKTVKFASGYRVYRYTSNGYKALKTTTATSYTVKKLKPNTKYTFAVRAYAKVDGKTKWAKGYSKVTVTTKSLIPAKSQITKCAIVSDSSYKLYWKKSADAEGYRIYSYNPSTKKYKVVAKTRNLYATLKNVDTTKTNYYAVKSWKKVGGKTYWSDYSKKFKTFSVPSKKEMTTTFNQAMLQSAYWFGWKPESPEYFDYKDILETKNGRYVRIKGDKIKSADDLRKHLRKFVDDDIAKSWAELSILKKNGKVYYDMERRAGGSGGIDLKYTKCVSRSIVDGKLRCKFELKGYEHSEDKYYDQKLTADFKLQSGRWVLVNGDWRNEIFTTSWTGTTYNPYAVLK